MVQKKGVTIVRLEKEVPGIWNLQISFGISKMWSINFFAMFLFQNNIGTTK